MIKKFKNRLGSVQIPNFRRFFPKKIKGLGNRIKLSWRNDKGFKKRFVIALVAGIFIITAVWIFWGLPLPTNLGDDHFAVSTKIFDRNGKLIYEIYGNQRRSPIKLPDLPDYVKKATISIEDKEFYTHKGFSITGIGRSIEKIIFERRLQGGSTITQQLVKNSLLTSERTVKRKIREFLLALIVESFYSKDAILEMYLNQIPYGGTAYGIEAASETYFGKPAKDLTLAEATYLAGLPASPSRYSPYGAHPELAKERQDEVLKQMVNDKYITQEERDNALKEEIKIKKAEDLKAPHFALWIKEQLAEKYGERVTEQGGLRVKTTLDLDLQNFAQNAVATEVGKLKKLKVGNGAALVTRPGSGEILAMVGSYDYFAEDEDGKVNIIFASRQPGSSIKPLNYVLGIMDKKITASTPLADVPTCFGVIGQPSYCPVNYDGNFHGAQQVRFALGNSFNIPAVRVLAINGIDHFIEFANKIGITTFQDPKNYGLSLTLGGGEVRPYDMAVAYGVLANEGVKQPLISILKVEDWKGKVLEETNIDNTELSGERVMEPEAPFIISHILLDNNARVAAFGEHSYLNVTGHPEVSVKTGTTNDRRDNWTIGYTKEALVVSWVGNNDNAPMSGAVSGVSGASPIWNRIIKYTLDRAEDGYFNPKDKDHAWPQKPENVVGVNVCTDSGNASGTPVTDTATPTPDPSQPAAAGCASRYEYFIKDRVGSSVSSGRTAVQIDKTTQALVDPRPKDPIPPENIEMQDRPFILDPLGTLICLDCQMPKWSVSISYPLKAFLNTPTP